MITSDELLPCPFCGGKRYPPLLTAPKQRVAELAAQIGETV